MSQHLFKTSKYEIICGWDRPMQTFFLVIDELDADDDEYIYSNLFDPKITVAQKDFKYFYGVLSKLGIKVPDGLDKALMRDKQNNAGNSMQEWPDSNL